MLEICFRKSGDQSRNEGYHDSGVDVKKAVTAPLLAPCFFRDAAAGITPHEQEGYGYPEYHCLDNEQKPSLAEIFRNDCRIKEDLQHAGYKNAE